MVSQPPTLLSLLTEIQESIANCLSSESFPTKINLRAASHHFHSIIAPYSHTKLLEVEKSPHCMANKLYACSFAFRRMPK